MAWDREHELQYFRDRYQHLKAARPARPPDVIKLISERELIYLAGLLDGEGCFGITFVNKRVMAVVSLQMTHRRVVEWSAKLIGVSFQGARRLNKPAHHAAQYGWKISGRRAALLCYRLIPYLRVKDRQAQLICDLSETIGMQRGPGVRVPAEVIELRLRIKARMHELNGRGHRTQRPGASNSTAGGIDLP